MKYALTLNEEFRGQAAFFHALVNEYVGCTYRPFVARIKPWSYEYGPKIWALSQTRAQKRIDGYLDMDEIARVRRKLTTKDNASIRFGVKKEGHGYTGERGDFCLTGGSVRDGHLAIFYRRLELIGGFAFDVCVIDRLSEELGLAFKSVQIFAVQADIYALRDGSGEKERLFQNLQRVFS